MLSVSPPTMSLPPARTAWDQRVRRDGRDVLGGGVGLLGADAALLDREGRRVARGVHAFEALHLRVREGRAAPPRAPT